MNSSNQLYRLLWRILPLSIASDAHNTYSFSQFIRHDAAMERGSGGEVRYKPTGFRGGGILALIIFILSACTPQITPTPIPQQPIIQTERTSTWGQVQRITQAEQADAPALLPRTDDILLVWTGTDANEARLYAQSQTGIQRILALKAYHPYSVTLFDGGQTVMMLWQDRLDNDESSHLLSATFSMDAVAERDVLSVSRQGIRRYSAAQVADGTIRTVYSTSEGIRSHLYFNHVDLQARPQQPQLLRQNADYPALVVAGGSNLYLYWIENERDIYTARINELAGTGALVDVRWLMQLDLETGDALDNFSVVFDESYAHLFWNIQRADGGHDVLYATGHVLNGIYSAPQPFGILQENVTVETSYNSGVVYRAQLATANFASWAMPLAGQHSTLPVAVQQENWLGVAYFQDGAMMGYQDVLESGTLIGIPAIGTERNRNLYLAWSEPTTQGYANLFLTTSRR
jgi:hypothetical protein